MEVVGITGVVQMVRKGLTIINLSNCMLNFMLHVYTWYCRVRSRVV